MEDNRSLAGRRILVPESRELDLFARMLEAQGAETMRCPLVTILDADDPAPIEAWLRRLASGSFDDLIILTGEGLRRLLAVAARAGIEAEVVGALKNLRTVTRGPKPARVLRELGLVPGLAADEPTTDGVIETLEAENLVGRRIGVQLYPGNPNYVLLDFLRKAAVVADPILPYRYASDSETGQVEAAIRAMADGTVDAVAFTSTPQVKRLKEVAELRGLDEALRRGLARVCVAAVGPVVASTIEELGGTVTVMPESSFHMKPLVNAIAESLGAVKS